MNRLVGICVYCGEDLYEDDLEIYDDKPIHNKCINKYREVGRYD